MMRQHCRIVFRYRLRTLIGCTAVLAVVLTTSVWYLDHARKFQEGYLIGGTMPFTRWPLETDQEPETDEPLASTVSDRALEHIARYLDFQRYELGAIPPDWKKTLNRPRPGANPKVKKGHYYSRRLPNGQTVFVILVVEDGVFTNVISGVRLFHWKGATGPEVDNDVDQMSRDERDKVFGYIHSLSSLFKYTPFDEVQVELDKREAKWGIPLESG